MENLDTVSELSPITLNDFYTRLSRKVSDYNARLLLQSALQNSGVKGESHGPLKKSEAKTICLQLIKQGGPAFQVGRDMYTLVQ